MGEVGLLLVQLLASSCRLLVDVGRMICSSVRDVHNEAYSGTWIVSAGERAAAAYFGTAGWACARLGSANGSSWTLITHDTFSSYSNRKQKCRKPTPCNPIRLKLLQVYALPARSCSRGWNELRLAFLLCKTVGAMGAPYDEDDEGL